MTCTRRLAGLAAVVWACASCGGGGGSGAPATPATPTPPAGDTVPVYADPPAPGKLPWPQHAPGLDRAGHERMLSSLWILNNFGLFQGDVAPDSVYLHDGLDIMLPNGTPIHAVADGIVAYVDDEMVAVSDDGLAGKGWLYVHLGQQQVQVGARVRQGQRLGVVAFQGLSHLHLSRARPAAAGSWGTHYIAEDPSAFFEFTDTRAPVIATPFHYFRNASGTRLASGLSATVSGAVDIVAGLRDPGEMATPPPGMEALVPRLTPARLQWTLRNAAGQVLRQEQFDFSRFQLHWRNDHARWPQQAQFLYKHPALFSTQPWYLSGLTYYTLTHLGAGLTDADGAQDADFSWNTVAVGADGQALYPNGRYEVELTVEDARGNRSTARDAVDVKNR